MSPPRDFVQQQWDDYVTGLAGLKVGEASQSFLSRRWHGGLPQRYELNDSRNLSTAIRCVIFSVTLFPAVC